jgi:UDP-3-O-[3-hydroxymyristoyl] glucosamine N-acyltransferase
MPATLAELAALVDGHVCGDASLTVTDALPLTDAKPDCITLVDSPQKLNQLLNSSALAAVVSEPHQACQQPQIVVKDVHLAFAEMILHLRGRPKETPVGVHSSAQIAADASIGEATRIMSGASVEAGSKIGARCIIHSGVTIMNSSVIGDDCVVFPNVVLYPGTVLGNRVILHAGVVLGADGFGYRQVDGRHTKASQLGWVEVEDDVEIGANSAIDRGTYGATRIGTGTKIDNLVHIAHNCRIGKHNLICAQVGIAGSSSSGDHVILAGQVGIADHVHLSSKTVACAQAGIMRNTEAGQVLLGSPAEPSKEKMKQFASMRHLPTIRRELKQLTEQVSELRKVLDRNCDKTKAA